MHFKYSNKNYQIQRYPKSSNRSLRPWSAADEYLIQYLDSLEYIPSNPLLVNDRFGFLSCVLHASLPTTVIHHFSQEKACRQNSQANQIVLREEQFAYPLDTLKPSSLAVIKVPKSLDLFHLQLAQLHDALTDDGEVVAAFMTRHFSPEMVQIAGQYFEEVDQSQAWKKSRLIHLRGKKELSKKPDFIHEVSDTSGHSFQQYFGVFSAHHIDQASQFLVDHLQMPKEAECVLDLASGNGYLSSALAQQLPEANIQLIDDFYLAVESSKLNLQGDRFSFHFGDCLDRFPADFFDGVVCNPPFHFEHETNIEVSLSLFQEVKKCLKPSGSFQLVANRHLNYSSHLRKWFSEVTQVAENEKFEVLLCKP
ncbi:methyltransferase [bacterium SCSIO 12741]|nr:methyltransferase [bacterium SCSIO 12741]